MKTPQEEVEIILSVLNGYAERLENKESDIDKMLRDMGDYDDLECDTDRQAYEILEEAELLAQIGVGQIEAVMDIIIELEKEV